MTAPTTTQRRTVAITGATGSMGSYTVGEFLRNDPGTRLRVLVRPSLRNRKTVRQWQSRGDVEAVWGDLLDPGSVAALVKGADVVLHIGGMVSPAADYFPEKTLRTNTGAARLIVQAIADAGQNDSTRLVYIGSVSQYGPRAVPDHWGGPGDHMRAALFDAYAQSKIEAERIVAESDIRRWVSLRQSGILSPQTLMKGSDPITFHVPVNGVLEWATVEDSARLMVAVSRPDVDDSFWCDFYDISSGPSFRLTNYEFESKLLAALGCPPPEKVFEPQWFATSNFHGIWYYDSDRLEKTVPFRRNIDADSYFSELKASLPFYFSLAPLAPAPLIKWAMRRIASHRTLGTLSWQKDPESERYKAYFAVAPCNSWNTAVAPAPQSEHPGTLADIGFDRLKSKDDLTISDMKRVALLRGGECLSETLGPEGIQSRLQWRDADGRTFTAKAITVSRGGHWRI